MIHFNQLDQILIRRLKTDINIMKIEYNRIFYAYFCCIIVGIAFLNSCKAQTNEAILEKADAYFENLNRESIQHYIDRESDLFEVIKQRKNKKMYEDLTKSCEEEGSHFKLYRSDTEKLLSTLYKNESSDFIIVNMINPYNNRILVSASTLTFSRKRNDQNLHIINNKYNYKEDQKQYELIKDSSISGFDAEKK